MVVNDRFKNFGKVVENSYRSIILNRLSFPIFRNRDDDRFFPQLRKNILRYAEVKNELENSYKGFRITLHDETRYTIESDRFRRPQPLYSILNIGG
jgi:hypothetical protein